MEDLLSAENGGMVNHIKGTFTFDDDGQRVQWARTELPAPHCNCTNRLLPHLSPSPSRHY